MKLLEYTFQHLQGFGEIREKELRKNKIYTWEDFEKLYTQQLTLEFYPYTSILSDSKDKLAKNDVTYFAKTLPDNLQYFIPHSFPEDTVFLDIESTGLSLYYDELTIVGWSNLNNYNVFIAGNKEEEASFVEAMRSAKCIVTFNGSLYDLPFLKKTFKDLILPDCHVDLRFFAKRLGYSGGQKCIETTLNFQRPAHLKDITGYEATILWYRYKEGDLSALKELIEYNSYDIDGMKFLLEKLTRQAILKDDLPIRQADIFEFSKFRSLLNFCIDPTHPGIFITPYKGCNTPAVTVHDLGHVHQKKVVGIDLTGSEKRASGWSLLQGTNASTRLISTDEELIRETINAQPAIISIDSPLSIPEGRTSFYDDDPYREKYGITRECERIMAKRGIKSYPCLIPSMQELTKRGMRLAQVFREKGFEVIESYPGAAQDIMGIPRKGKSLEFLIKGLKNFGINGTFDQQGVSHDEIDAITSAVVGYFYLANRFEKLGNEKEGYLIVPKV